VSESSDRNVIDLTRREALAIFAALPLSLGLGPGSLAAHTWQEIRQHLPVDGAPYAPRFFTADEWRTVRVLVDDVIPRDERSGSATDAGVPEFMDAIMLDQPDSQTAMRVGLQWIDVESHRRFSQLFAASTPQQRASLLDDIAWPARTPVGMEAAVSFFSAFRDLTASGFWSSRIGVADLQYMGNAAVRDWQGCPAPALAKLGVSY
jgi:gluconate 2-dehydrogenase gamma chain